MALTKEQRDDLGTVLARIGRDNLLSLATHLELEGFRVELREPEVKFARRIVDAIEGRNLLNPAITWLRQGKSDPQFEVYLREVLEGRRINDASKQALRSAIEPFFSMIGVTELTPKIGRTVCAIGVSKLGELVGSGFLIAPDLVMTNFHVLETCVDRAPNQKPGEESWVETVDGNDIYCFFDYHAPPEPDVPPSKWALESTVCVKASAKGWLIYARRGVTPEGTLELPETDAKEYDCIVIKLAEPIGKSAVRNAGNRRRGWLSLPDEINIVHAVGQKLIVFQHPNRKFQSLDFGDYKKLHPSQTRVWYAVSTAHGSSGGAAVDSKGTLFALHNATVTDPTDAATLNQGVRIDLINKDIRASLPDLKFDDAGEDAYPWSMSDNAANPEPIIGRTGFMKLVGEITTSKTDRSLVVIGPPGSGVGYSARILGRVLGPQVRTVEFSALELQDMRPRQFLQALLFKLGVGHPVDAAPRRNETEQVSTSQKMDLPKWLIERLNADPSTAFDTHTPAAPAWVIVNAMMPPPAKLLWADHLKDFLALLTGASDAGQQVVDVPELRWLILGYSADDLPIHGRQKYDEDLSNYVDHVKDFVDCITRAWLTIDKFEIPTKALMTNFADYIKANPGGLPLRLALSNVARKIIIEKGVSGD
jgi:hypothetical protein